MYDSAFQPTGPTVTVDGTTRQVPSTMPAASFMQYRIRNVNTTGAYIAYSTPNIASGTPTVTVTAPVAGTPQANTIGMLGSSVEVFTLPAGAFFIASAGTFEVTPGEGY
jgi:hypothetical protein